MPLKRVNILSEIWATQTKVGWFNGVVIATKKGAVIFDPSKKSPNESVYTFISHAHSDHIKGINSQGKGYLTIETKDILSKRNYKRKLCNFTELRYGDEVTVNELTISVHNSGHILGSAQYVIRDDESTIVYTGDINCRKMLTTTAAEIIPCDILILETTYGSPFYVFPSLTEVYTNIVTWAIGEIKKEKTPTFIVYSVGKAQEIIKIFNEFTKIPVLVSKTIAQVNEAYTKHGVRLTYLEAALKKEKGSMKQYVQVITPFEKPLFLDRYSFATATGWALKSNINYTNSHFPLSGHADFNQLVDYVKYAKPKKVYTIHGFKEVFSSYISKKLGITARAIPAIKQSNLRMYM